MNTLKNIFNYFFRRRVVFTPMQEEIYIKRKDEHKEIKSFFEPITEKDKFNESTSLKDFIKKIDKK